MRRALLSLDPHLSLSTRPRHQEQLLCPLLPVILAANLLCPVPLAPASPRPPLPSRLLPRARDHAGLSYPAAPPCAAPCFSSRADALLRLLAPAAPSASSCSHGRHRSLAPDPLAEAMDVRGPAFLHLHTPPAHSTNHCSASIELHPLLSLDR